MKVSSRILFVVLLLALSTLACSLTGGGGNGDTPPDQPNNVLFQDDFSNSNSGWQTLREDGEVIDYENGAFRIFINQPDYDYWSVNDLDLADVRIEVDATKTAGPDDNDFGLICRYQDADNFYGLLISSDGYYGISKMAAGEHNIIGSDGMQFSDKITTGAVTNRLTAECIGSKLALYVNGEKLVEVEDGDYTSGGIGLVAGTFTEPGVDISFDNLVVTKP